MTARIFCCRRVVRAQSTVGPKLIRGDHWVRGESQCRGDPGVTAVMPQRRGNLSMLKHPQRMRMILNMCVRF